MKFLSSQDLTRIYDLIDNLDRAAHFLMGSARISAGRVKQRLDALRLPSRVSLNQVENAAREITGNPFGSADFKSRERISAVQERLRAYFPSASWRVDEETQTFLDTLFAAYDNDTLLAALDYIEYQSHGHSLKIALGSDEYLKKVAAQLFGNRFVRSTPPSALYDFVGVLKQQAAAVLGRIRMSILLESQDCYMEYDARQLVLKATAELARLCGGYPIRDAEINRLRRLEDFDNKVIEIDRVGSQYPVDAELKWEKGKNVLALSARIYFPEQAEGLVAELLNLLHECTLWLKDVLRWLDESARTRGITPRGILDLLGDYLFDLAVDVDIFVGAFITGSRPPVVPLRPPGNFLVRRILSAAQTMFRQQGSLVQAMQWFQSLVDTFELAEQDLVNFSPLTQRANRKAEALKGFRSWAGTYTVFGGQTLEVDTSGIYEVFADVDAVPVYLIEKSEVLEKVMSSLNVSMSWGGTFPNILDWKPDAEKLILLRSTEDYMARHEFGHTLGLGDAYEGDTFGPGIDASQFEDLQTSANVGGYPVDQFVMNNRGARVVTNNDIEMLVLAFATGKRQNYQVGPFNKIVSEALGIGN